MCGFSSTNLLDVTLPDGRFIEYVTDGRHRRIAKKVNGAVVRRWVYQDQLNPTAELDGNGTVLYRYAYGSMAHSPDFVVNATGETYRVIRDQLGSPLLVVNIHDENDVLLEARYSAFGNRTVIAGDGSALTLGFAGGIYDEDTGLTRFGARDYDAVVGRWTSKDPILWGGGQGNLYVYVGGDAVNYADPKGLAQASGGMSLGASVGNGNAFAINEQWLGKGDSGTFAVTPESTDDSAAILAGFGGSFNFALGADNSQWDGVFENFSLGPVTLFWAMPDDEGGNWWIGLEFGSEGFGIGYYKTYYANLDKLSAPPTSCSQ